MATGTVVFQSNTLASPPASLAVMADAVNDADHGAGTTQYVKIMDAATGGTAKASVTTANGLAVDVTRVQGTVQALGSIQSVGTSQVLGTTQPLAGSVHLASSLPGTVQALGSIQSVGTSQILGTVQAVGSLPLIGTGQFLGTVQPLAGSVHAQGVVAHDGAVSGNPLLIAAFGSSGTQAAVNDGDVTRLWTDLNGRLQVRGTIDSLVGTVQVHGTAQALGTVQPLSGSVHVANVLSGTFQAHGTNQALGTVQTHGTSQILGTTQPLAGSVHIASILPGGSTNTQGVIAHGAAVGGNPLLIAGFGSSGTQAAVDDGDLTRIALDLNGRVWTNVQTFAGTIGGGTIQTHGTSQVLGTIQPLAGSVHVANVLSGTFQSHGTNQALGTFQPLAGSVHLATNLAGGTVVAVGSALHGAAADSRPFLISAFGSSGTQVAIDDGDVVRLWADLNGRLQIRGTIDSLPPVTATNLDIRDLSSASDSVAVVGTVQTHGTSQVLGTVQGHGTFQTLGSIQTVGTSQALGTIQPLAGSVHVANAISGTVRSRPVAAGEGFFGTRFTAATTNGTIVPGPAAGTYVRVWGLIASGSAAGSAFFEFGDGTVFGAIFTAANGGMVYTSAKGIRTNGTAQDIFFNCAAGTWGVSVEYTLET